MSNELFWQQSLDGVPYNNNEDDMPTFEDFSNENGITFWWATTLMRLLGYQDLKSFEPAINRATKACIALSIPHYDNIMSEKRIDDNGNSYQDFKLTRFACYLITVNADVKKPQVAAAQVYFIEQARRLELYLQNQDQLDRIIIRDEVKEGNKSLASVAKDAGVVSYGLFQDAGYLGMYNMRSGELAVRRRVDKSDLFEYMGRAELAANLFRITQTEERIKNFGIKGQQNLENTHNAVGKEVRKVVISNTGKAPEQLPIEAKITDGKKKLKEQYKLMTGKKPKK